MRWLTTARTVTALTALAAAGVVWWRGDSVATVLPLPGANALTGIVANVRELAAFAYARAPEIMLALGAATLMLAIGCVLMLGRWLRRRRRLQELYAAALIEPMPTASDAYRTRPSARAWLEVIGSSTHVAHTITREIVRIGSDADNDVVLQHGGVAPFHAVIRRSQNGDFVIFDISGGADSPDDGVKVNGKRPISAPLRNDDVIELGKARLSFKRRPAAASRLQAEVPDTTTA